jgi:periplasmic divalent cation tolerance protein
MTEATNSTSSWTIRRLRVGRLGAGLRRLDVLGHAAEHYNNFSESTSAMDELILILTTMPDDDRAAGLARTLVEERLAACVNVLGPMTSTYRWQGRIEVAAERQVVVKTTRANLVGLQERLRALHPYDLPELVVIDAAGSEAYATWVRDSTP